MVNLSQNVFPHSKTSFRHLFCLTDRKLTRDMDAGQNKWIGEKNSGFCSIISTGIIVWGLLYGLLCFIYLKNCNMGRNWTEREQHTALLSFMFILCWIKDRHQRHCQLCTNLLVRSRTLQVCPFIYTVHVKNIAISSSNNSIISKDWVGNWEKYSKYNERHTKRLNTWILPFFKICFQFCTLLFTQTFK